MAAVAGESALQGLLASVRRREWFYEFDLPDGTKTKSYLPAGVEKIHATRLAMLDSALEPIVGSAWAAHTVVDLACHQGFFATHVARRGAKSVLAVDTREEHLADTRLMADVYGLLNLSTACHDIEELRSEEIGQFDVCLMLGLLYHVENPVRLLRLARAVTRKACVIETQVVPNMTGVVDWGAYTFQRHMVGSFAIIDETAETHAPEASAKGICVTPSYEALVWLLGRVGFSRISRVSVPTGGYEQLQSGKRVMVLAQP